MGLPRRIDPEWLDELPADDPRAVRSRRDLQLVNRIMGHATVIGRALTPCVTADSARIAEIGSGDGTLMLRVLAKVEQPCLATLVFVDRQPVVTASTLARYVERGDRVTVDPADVFEWLARQTGVYDVVVANLFLHHFEAPRLAALFQLAARCTKAFIACEPRRHRLPLAGSRLLGLLGCNDVTRHDAYLSVRAGFTGTELSQLWPAAEGWDLQERRAGLFSHVFIARNAADCPTAG